MLPKLLKLRPFYVSLGHYACGNLGFVPGMILEICSMSSLQMNTCDLVMEEDKIFWVDAPYFGTVSRQVWNKQHRCKKIRCDWFCIWENIFQHVPRKFLRLCIVSLLSGPLVFVGWKVASHVIFLDDRRRIRLVFSAIGLHKVRACCFFSEMLRFLVGSGGIC